MNGRLCAILAAGLLAAPVTAQATLVGQSLDCDFQPDELWDCSPANAAVTDPGIEFTLDLAGVSFFSVDIGPSSILLTLISSGGLGMGAGELLTLGGFQGILDASLGFTTASSGFDASDLFFTPSSVTLRLTGTSWSPGQQALIDVTMATVPEPGTLVLLGLGLFGLGFSRRGSFSAGPAGPSSSER
jgi:hypothetical protein